MLILIIVVLLNHFVLSDEFDCAAPLNNTEFLTCTTKDEDVLTRLQCMNQFLHFTRSPTIQPSSSPTRTTKSPTSKKPTLFPTVQPTPVSFYKFRCLNPPNPNPLVQCFLANGAGNLFCPEFLSPSWDAFRRACVQPGKKGSIPLLTDGRRNIKETLFSQTVFFKNDADELVAGSPDLMFGPTWKFATLQNPVLRAPDCGSKGNVYVWLGLDWGGSPHSLLVADSCREDRFNSDPWTTFSSGRTGGVGNAYEARPDWMGGIGA
jgi:hypothetical protein